MEMITEFFGVFGIVLFIHGMYSGIFQIIGSKQFVIQTSLGLILAMFGVCMV